MIEIQRVYLEAMTLGSWYIDGVLACKTMELPDKGNARSISCIPEGEYDVDFEETSPKHKYPHFRLPNVKGRSGILVHKITYAKDLRGCIGVGSAFADINKDGLLDITGSGLALTKLISLLPLKFKLTIKKKP